MKLHDHTPWLHPLNHSLRLRRGWLRLGALALCLACLLGQGGFRHWLRLTVFADNTAQTLPFSQNWTSPGLITADDNWSGVPGIIGYRGDDLTTATGADPQTILAAGTGTPVDVIANQSNPNALATGGVAEFDGIANPTVALQGSSTADAPHLLLHLDTTGMTGINISYNLRDIDGSTDNAVQPVALQYRVGNSGNFINVPAGFVADATAGPSLASLVTPVSVTLPAAVDNQALAQVRIITTNAVGNDEWVGIDDINVSTTPGLPTLNIGDVTLAEGDPPGTTTFTFAVTLTAQAGPGGVTFDLATADGTAQDDNPTTEDNDYVAQSLTGQAIPAGSTGPYNFSVTVNRDTVTEPNETFFVNVTNITGANAGDPQGQGTINNDDVTLVQIHDIQGPGASSPLVGSSVTTRGIVTGVKNNGFFIQEPDASVDADPATSEGIFVFTGSAPPVAAAFTALVQVTGTVAEFVPGSDPRQPPLTELTAPTVVQILPPGQTLPTAVTLSATFPAPAGPFDQLERVEGMRVSAASITVTGPSDGSINEANNTGASNGRFHGVITGVARPFREPGIQQPDNPPVGAIPPLPRWDSNPERLRIESATINSQPILTVKTGDVVAPVVGPLDYGFRGYALYPDGTLGAPTVTPGTLPTLVTTPTAQEFTVASFNMFRFYDTTDDGGVSDVALTVSAFNDRLNKASIAIRNHLKFPDILGVQEMENLATLQTLATKVNNDAVMNAQPNPLYVAFLSEGNDIGGIDVGFLVKTAPGAGGAPRVTVNSVTQIGAATTWIDPDDGLPALLNDRPALVLDAVINRASGASFPVLVINNHLRSLIGIDSSAPDGMTTQGDRVRRKRQTQADFLAQYIQSRLMATPGAHLILVGDFNAFEFNDGYADVINTLTGTPPPDNQTVVCSTCPTAPNTNDGVDQVNPDLLNLVNTPPAAQRYSYLHAGNAQNLDHVIVSAGLVADTSARRIEHPRINADYPETERANKATALRISDHDPVVAYFTAPALALADLAVTKVDTPDPVTAGANLTYTITVTNNGPDTASAVSWSDTLPAGTTFVSLANPADWSCTTPLAGASGTVSCSIASLALGNAVFTLVVKAGSAVASGTSLNNTATVSSPTADPSPGNESGMASTLVTGFACPTSFTVNSLADSGDATIGDGVCNDGTGNCTLRAALQEANALAAVPCAPFVLNLTATGIITLGSALPNLNHPNLTLNGPGAKLLALSGNNANRVFNIASGKTVGISGLTITGGRDTAGLGAGIANSGTLTLTNVVVSGNTSSGAGGAGGLASSGALMLINSTVSDNSGTGDAAAGGLFSTGTTSLTNSTVSGNTNSFAAGIGGIVQSGGMLTLTNSTVSGNRTVDGGGGLLVSANGTANLLNSTVTANHADNADSHGGSKNGGGIKVVLGAVTLSNTIVAGNYRGSGTTTADDIRGSVTANFSLIGNTTGATISGGNNLSGNPLLAALANYGGPTQTHALLPGSPAINAGTASGAPATDQRGSARVGAPDSGAVEAQGFTLLIASGNNQSTPVNTNFANPLQVNVIAHNVNEPVNGGLVTFTPPGSGAAANSAGNPATIVSGQATSGAVMANSTAGTYNVAASANGATPVNFTLTNLPLPTITTQSGVARQQGSATANSQLATASDTVDPVNTLQISVSSDGTNFGNAATLNGVTVTLTDSNAGAAGNNPAAPGQVFANVSAACTASNASFTLKVTGSSNRMATAVLFVAATTNTPPTLSYANQSVAAGGSLNVSPTTAADNGALTGYSIVSVTPPLNVAPTVNAAGVVMIASANPPGSHTITVRASDNCNASSDASFTLDVTPSGQLSGSLTDPLVCTGPGNALTGTIQLSNPTAAAQSFTLTTTFTNYFGLPGPCTLTGAVGMTTCNVTTGGLTAGGSIPANATLTVRYQAQVPVAPPGTVLTATSTATLGGAPVAPNPLVFATTVNCPAVGPGLLIADAAEVSAQKPGSVLFYNLYSSSSSAPNTQNTRIAITNTHPALAVAVHLFFVDGASCSIADSLICLTPQQTASFLASDIDPGVSGYLVAVASDTVTGCPVNFNYLIGAEYVKLASGHAANLTAEGFAALAGGLPACDANSTTALLNFDGVSYNRAPRTLAASNIPSRGDGNDTLLVLNRLGGSLLTGAAPLTNLFGLLYDDAENPLSFNFNPGTCQFRSSLSNNFPRIALRFEQFIPTGRSGWAKFYSTDDIGLLGALLNFNANVGTAANAFNQGHNLHKLTLAPAVQLTIPIFPPNC